MSGGWDFVGFTFNGKHSVDDLKIYRTSDGQRYNETANRALADKIVDLNGQDGSLLLSTQQRNKTFNISFAFDSLTYEDIQQLKKVFDGMGVHDLIFDEYPYKTYQAKVKGTPEIKYICFDEGGQEIYKGEGIVNFICYQPFAVATRASTKLMYARTTRTTPTFWENLFTIYRINQETGERVTVGTLQVQSEGEINTGTVSLPLQIYGQNAKQGDKIIAGEMWCRFEEDVADFVWNTDTGAVYDKTTNKMIKTSGKLVGSIPTKGKIAVELVDNNSAIAIINIEYQLRYY